MNFNLVFIGLAEFHRVSIDFTELFSVFFMDFSRFAEALLDAAEFY